MSKADRRFHSFHMDFDQTICQIKSDIETAQRVISDFQQQTFIQRSISTLKKSHSAVIATGKNIYDIHPSQIALRYCKKLKNEPKDMITRLELINLILKGAKPTYKEYYILFIQATAITTMSEISIEAVGIVLFLQDKVFSLLLEQCNEHFDWLQGKLQRNSADKSRVVMQIHKEIEKLNYTRHGLSIILKQVQNGLKSWHDHPGLSLNRQAVINLKQLQIDAMDQNKQMSQNEFKIEFKRPGEIALAARHSILLHEQVIKMIHFFTFLQPDSGYPFFIMGRIRMMGLNFTVEHYRVTKNPAISKNIHLEFKNVYQYYLKAARMIPPTTQSSTDFTVLLEFANLVHYYYQVSKSVIGKPPSGEGFKNVLQTALKMAQTAQESGQADTLIRDLHSDILSFSDLGSSTPRKS